MRLFAYGSLKRGHFNHGRFGFNKTATLIGEGMVDGVTLVQMENTPYPHAVNAVEGQVKGELYELPAGAVWDSIERMELGAGYVPQNVRVMLDNESIEEAVMYVASDYITKKYLADDNGKLLGQTMREWKE